MRRLDLIKYHEILFDVINAEIERLKYLHDSCEDEMTKRAFKFFINVLEEQKRSTDFSRMCRRIRKNGLGITDLDKILVVNGEIKALFEMKFRREDFNGRMFANAFQFITLRKLAFKSGLPLYYVYEIGEYKDKWFKVILPTPKIREEADEEEVKIFSDGLRPKDLGGKGLPEPTFTEEFVPRVDVEEVLAMRKVPVAKLPVEKRVKKFDEVELGYSKEEAVQEAKRCWRCDWYE